MKIVVIGAGAMGCLFGGKLAAVCDLWLVDRWPEHVQALQTQGLRLQTTTGVKENLPVQAASTVAETGGPADLALIFVKSPGTLAASRLAATILKPDGLALSMQNGLGNAAVIAQALDAGRVVQGVTSHGATLVGPGQVRHAGAGPTHLATTPHTAAKVSEIAQHFQEAGFETHLSDNLDSLLWGKLVINVGINALTAILQVPNGRLIEIGPAEELMQAAVAEAVQVAQAKGIILPYADPQTQVKQVALATASNRSSMLSDVVRAVPTEIEVINGAVVREGKEVGVETPINQTLVQLVQAIEATYQDYETN